MHNLVNAARGDMDGVGEAVLAKAQGGEVFDFQDFPGMHRFEFIGLFCHKITSMVVDDFHFVGGAFVPHETNPPLIVDSDAMLPRPISF